jgi:hypothetical protein
MVCELGMSPKVGPISTTADDENPFLGREFRLAGNVSERTMQTIDEEVRRIVDGAVRRRRRAAAGQSPRRLDAVAAALLKHETLSGDEIAAVLRGDDLEEYRQAQARQQQAAAAPKRAEAAPRPAVDAPVVPAAEEAGRRPVRRVVGGVICRAASPPRCSARPPRCRKTLLAPTLGAAAQWGPALLEIAVFSALIYVAAAVPVGHARLGADPRPRPAGRRAVRRLRGADPGVRARPACSTSSNSWRPRWCSAS